MRRDLAVCRERSGDSEQPAKVFEASEVREPLEQTEVQQAVEPEPAQPEAVVSKNESAPVKDDVSTSDPAPEAANLLEDSATHDDIVINEPHDMKSHQDETAQAVLPEDKADPGDPKGEQKLLDSTLQIDTTSQTPAVDPDKPEEADQDKPPDTAHTFGTNADLDSLFNDPMSAGAGGSGEEPDFSAEQNVGDDFDFEAFSANLDSNTNDNDNIASLLPGLQDYANTQPEGNSGQADFDALFATDAPVGADVGGDETGNAQGGLAHRDSTFDDLMDFGDFNAGDFAAAEDESENQAFEFS